MISWIKSAFTSKSEVSPQNSISYEDIYGGGSSSCIGGVNVNAHTAMAQPAVYACVNLLSWVMASLPLKLINRKDGTIAYDTSLYSLLSYKPNKFQTPFEVRDMQMTSLLLYGVSYSRIYRNSFGEVVTIIPLHPQQVYVEFDQTKQDLKFYITYKYTTGMYHEEVYSKSMMVIRGKHSDIVTPVSPISAQARNIAASEVLQDHKYNFFGVNAAKPGGVIEAEGRVDENVAKRILSLFNSRYADSKNSGKTILLEQSLKFKPLQMSNTDAQFLELCRFSVEDICKMYNVAPSMIHQNDTATYASAVQQAVGFLKFTLIPYLEMLEQVYLRDIFTEDENKRYKLKFDVATLLRGDNESTANYLVKLVQGGLMTPNEGRDFLGLSEMPGKGANQLYIQQNQVSVDQLDKMAASASAPPPAPANPNNTSNALRDLLQFENELTSLLGDKKDVI